MKSLYYFTNIECGNGHKAPRLRSSGQCVECAAAWREKNKEKIAAEYKKWAAEKADHLKAYNDNWRAENAEHVRKQKRELNRKYRAADPRKFADRAMEYYHRKMQDPEFRAKQSLKASLQRAKRKGAAGEFNSEDVAEILKRQKYKCAECGVSVRRKINRHVDHIIPIALGGTSWPNNLQILCPPCNLSKGAKDPIVFAQRKGRLL